MGQGLYLIVSLSVLIKKENLNCKKYNYTILVLLMKSVHRSRNALVTPDEFTPEPYILKNEQIRGDPLLSTDKLAEKVRISGRQYFGTKVR